MKPDRSPPEYMRELSTALRWDPERQELYLRLPSFPHLRLVLLRPGIEDDLLALFNSPDVGRRLYRLPFPMSRSFVDTFVADPIPAHRALHESVLASLPSPPSHFGPIVPAPDAAPVPLSGFPFKSVYDMATGRVVGDVNLAPHVDTEENPDAKPEDVLQLPPREQTWMLGYTLLAEYGGKGLMSEIIGVVIETWARQWMRVGGICGYTETDNHGSMAVLRRNGLERVETFMSAWPEAKGGGERESAYFYRSLEP